MAMTTCRVKVYFDASSFGLFDNLLEVVEDRYGVRSTMITSQLPIDKWHDVVGDSTIADAILDRLVHNAYRVFLQGDSLRKDKMEVNTER